MARDHNTMQKRLREMAKKRKAEEKRDHRRKKKAQTTALDAIRSERSTLDLPESDTEVDPNS